MEYPYIPWQPDLKLPPDSDSVKLNNNIFILKYRYFVSDSTNRIIYIEKIIGLSSNSSIDDCINISHSVSEFISDLCLAFLAKFSLFLPPKNNNESLELSFITESCWKIPRINIIHNSQIMESCPSAKLYKTSVKILNENMAIKLSLRRNQLDLNDPCNNRTYKINSSDCFPIWQ